MADSVERLRRDLRELRDDVMELLATASSQLDPELGIPLEVFARLVGLEPVTLQRAVRSKDPLIRARWPVFYRPIDGKACEHTTIADIRRWREQRCRSTAPVSPAVVEALSAMRGRGGRRAAAGQART